MEDPAFRMNGYPAPTDYCRTGKLTDHSACWVAIAVLKDLRSGFSINEDQ
jgi:hypothetical protein